MGTIFKNMFLKVSYNNEEIHVVFFISFLWILI